jgi:hypothetical protein
MIYPEASERDLFDFPSVFNLCQKPVELLFYKYVSSDELDSFEFVLVEQYKISLNAV